MNAMTDRFDADACVHELFQRQVVRTPNAIALSCAGRDLTYSDLNARANQLAHHLRRVGIGPDDLVGVCLDRSPELVVALLAVWKAGGAYVPLDPAYPQDRLSFMMSDSRARVLLADERSLGLFDQAGPQALCIDSGWKRFAKESPADPAPVARPSNLAYVMYTSGSTGMPKGAMIEHRGLLNYLAWAIDAYKVKAGDCVPVHSSIAFDLTVTSLYPALLVGARVELLREQSAGQALVAALREGPQRALVKITPAHLQLLGEQLGAGEAARTTRCFVIGGENLPAEILRFWRANAPATRLVNEYGPTETVVGCCTYEVQAGDPDHGPVPIGQPIANTELYVLDERMQPMPPGTAGELYIGGAGVARGYLNRPDLTRERFIADPFSRRPDARLYKTGDLARRRADGLLEYLGRADNQVKIRGHRIELGEVEAALARHPSVHSCAVLARDDGTGSRQLVACIVARAGQAPTLDGLRAFLAEWLPEFMVPARLVLLERLPLTHNGKVDRDALGSVCDASKAPEPRLAADAGSATERSLLELWSRLLQVESLGVDDDFFDRGAHSLLVMRAVVQMREAFGVELQLADILESPTVSGLAKVIERLAWARGGASAPRSDRETLSL